MEGPRELIPLKRPVVDDEIETYQRDGLVCLRGLFDLVWVEGFRDFAERMLTAETRIFNAAFVWPRVHGVRHVVFDSPAAAIAAAAVYDSRDGTQPMLWSPNIPVGSSVDAGIWPVI